MMRINFFHSLFILVSIVSLVSVEARKLNSINGGRTMKFTVDLIHRDSLLSPEDRRKRQSSGGSVSRGSHRAFTSSRMTAAENKDVVADVSLGGGDYLVQLAIGTPQFPFYAVADTGSDLIWLQCTGCQPCIAQPSAADLFDPTNSSTYGSVSCGSQLCVDSEVSNGCSTSGGGGNDTGVCLYGVKYGDQTASVGILSTETITFPDSSTTLSGAVFGCGLAQQGSVSNGDGIIGLGAGPLSLPSQLGQNINYKFSYCLVPCSSTGEVGTSKLKFGADLISAGSVSTPYTTLSNIPDYYLVSLDKISVGTSEITVGQNIIVDSGSTLTSLDTSTYNAVIAAVNASIGMSSFAGPSGMELCYVASLDSLNAPEVVLHFGGGDVVLKGENVFWDLGNQTCLAIVETQGNGIPILGNIGQANFEVGYDLKNKMVSFAPTDCTKY